MDQVKNRLLEQGNRPAIVLQRMDTGTKKVMDEAKAAKATTEAAKATTDDSHQHTKGQSVPTLNPVQHQILQASAAHPDLERIATAFPNFLKEHFAQFSANPANIDQYTVSGMIYGREDTRIEFADTSPRFINNKTVGLHIDLRAGVSEELFFLKSHGKEHIEMAAEKSVNNYVVVSVLLSPKGQNVTQKYDYLQGQSKGSFFDYSKLAATKKMVEHSTVLYHGRLTNSSSYLVFQGEGFSIISTISSLSESGYSFILQFTLVERGSDDQPDVELMLSELELLSILDREFHIRSN